MRRKVGPPGRWREDEHARGSSVRTCWRLDAMVLRGHDHVGGDGVEALKAMEAMAEE